MSLPKEVFEDAERLARKLGKSRSQLCAEAVAEYVARHAPEGITAQMNQVCDEVGTEVDAFVAAAGRRALKRSEW